MTEKFCPPRKALPLASPYGRGVRKDGEGKSLTVSTHKKYTLVGYAPLWRTLSLLKRTVGAAIGRPLDIKQGAVARKCDSPLLVDPKGVEPSAFRMRTERSPN